jgi:diguanylate cyclase (GGDEF)-like protein/PAS domain S-box-containing protein
MMGTISPGECSALYRLVAESPTDLVLKTDMRGRIVHATPASARLGLAFAGDPVGRHLLELLHPSCAEVVLAEHGAALSGKATGTWIEVLAIAQDGAQRWLEMKLGALPAGTGALGLLRSIEDRRTLEDRLFVAAMTDPLTRLTNRDAFTRMLGHLAESKLGGHLALFDLDHFRSINLQYGHSGGDRVLVATAGLMRALLGPDDIISRIGGGSFGVLLPDADEARTRIACERIVEAMADLARDMPRGLRLSASAGLARIAISADIALRNAELALLAAKSHGRGRVECARAKPRPWSSGKSCH